MTLAQVFLCKALHLMMPDVILMNACFSSQCKESGAFSVVVDNYVRDDDGTGVVHQAPYFGAVSQHLHCAFIKFFPSGIYPS